jgi:hypothetical protein
MTSRRFSWPAALLAVSFAFAGARPVAADTSGSSTISQIKVLDVADDNYQFFHGAVWLAHDKAEHNYRWGGKHCGGVGLSESSVELLFAAFRDKHSVAIDFRIYKYKTNVARCITAFTVTRT